MNIRSFLTASSLVLIGWMTASYFSAVPLEGYAQDKPATPEVAFTSAEKALAEVE